MAITYPLALLDDFPGWTIDFELAWRQEQSRHASGRTRVKDFGSPIWRGAWVSRTLSANQLSAWRARLRALENGQHEFIAYESARCRPMAHPGSAALPSGTLHTIGSNNKSVRVESLVGITLSVGDHIQIGENLYSVQEQASGSPTAMFEVRPHLWPGTSTGDPVVIHKPRCLMTIDPRSVSATADPRTGRGSISFSATESRG